MSLYQIDYVVCPWCGERSGKQVSHLYDEPLPRPWGPWYCEECRGGFSGTVNAPGDVVVHKVEDGARFSRSMALLKFDGKEGPVFFVMDHDRYRTRDGLAEDDEQNQASQSYFFEEGSCPTNWLCECVAVIEDGDCDPHGFLDFVRAVDVPQNFDADDDGQWPLLFPEAFGGSIIDGVATVVNAAKLLAADK